MANTLIGARSPKGNVGVRGVLDSGELSAFSAGAMSGFNPNTVSSFTINIGGISGVQDVAVAKNPAGESELLAGTSGSSIAFTIGGAPGTPGQSRTDALVLYKDPFATSTSNDGIDTVDYQVVAGTAATTGSQVPPTDATIRSTIPTGSLKFVAVIGYVTVAYGQTSVTTANYFRNRSLIQFRTVANATELSLLTPSNGMEVFQLDTETKWIYDGTSWLNIPRLLKRVLLTATGSSISLTGIPLRDSYKLKTYLKSAGGTMLGVVRFNNDSGTNYAENLSSGGGTYTTAASATGIQLFSTAETYSQMSVVEIGNPSTDFKTALVSTQDMFGTDASTTSNFYDARGKWASNTQINRVDVVKGSGTGSFAAGSYAEIYG